MLSVSHALGASTCAEKSGCPTGQVSSDSLAQTGHHVKRKYPSAVQGTDEKEDALDRQDSPELPEERQGKNESPDDFLESSDNNDETQGDEPKAPSLTTLRKLDYQLDFQRVAKKYCLKEMEACKEDVLCEEAMFDHEGIANEKYASLMSCMFSHEPKGARSEPSLLEDEEVRDVDVDIAAKTPSFGNQIGMGALGGVAGNMATAAVSAGVGLMWDGIEGIPGGEEVAKVGRSITCAFGMGCDAGPSNTDVMNKVEAEANRVIDQVGGMMSSMKTELKKDIGSVKKHMTDVKTELLGEMEKMGNKISSEMSKGFTNTVSVVRQESQKVLESISVTQALLRDMKDDLEALAKKHHFENKATICDTFASKLSSRYRVWNSNMNIAQGKIEKADADPNQGNKVKRLRDAVKVMNDFFRNSLQSESSIRGDMATLLDCLADNNDVFSRQAEHLQSKSMRLDAKVRAMDYVFGRYLTVFEQADAVFTAKLVHVQLNDRNMPDLREVLLKLTEVRVMRAKLYYVFWKALNTKLISHRCPACVRRGASRRWGRQEITHANDRRGSGCDDVDDFVTGYLTTKARYGKYDAVIQNYAKSLKSYSSDSDTVCKIHRVYSWDWRGGCYGSKYGGSYQYYTDKRRFSATMWCSGW